MNYCTISLTNQQNNNNILDGQQKMKYTFIEFNISPQHTSDKFHFY